MKIERLTAVGVRNLQPVELAPRERFNVFVGQNGQGKTNLLEGLYFACTGRSCRTSNEREVVKFGAAAARVVLSCEADDGLHELSVGFVPGQPKAMRVDGAS